MHACRRILSKKLRVFFLDKRDANLIVVNVVDVVLGLENKYEDEIVCTSRTQGQTSSSPTSISFL